MPTAPRINIDPIVLQALKMLARGQLPQPLVPDEERVLPQGAIPQDVTAQPQSTGPAQPLAQTSDESVPQVFGSSTRQAPLASVTREQTPFMELARRQTPFPTPPRALTPDQPSGLLGLSGPEWAYLVGASLSGLRVGTPGMIRQGGGFRPGIPVALLGQIGMAHQQQAQQQQEQYALGQQLEGIFPGAGQAVLRLPQLAGPFITHAEKLRQDQKKKAEQAAYDKAFDEAMIGQSIDTSRPILKNPDGSYSTERTITIEQDGKHILIPTIVNGKQLSPSDAISEFKNGRNPSVGVFGTSQEAERAAVERSRRIGKIRGLSDQPVVPDNKSFAERMAHASITASIATRNIKGINEGLKVLTQLQGKETRLSIDQYKAQLLQEGKREDYLQLLQAETAAKKKADSGEKSPTENKWIDDSQHGETPEIRQRARENLRLLQQNKIAVVDTQARAREIGTKSAWLDAPMGANDSLHLINPQTGQHPPIGITPREAQSQGFIVTTTPEQTASAGRRSVGKQIDVLQGSMGKIFKPGGFFTRAMQAPNMAWRLWNDPDVIAYEAAKVVLATQLEAMAIHGRAPGQLVNQVKNLYPKVFPIPDNREIAEAKMKQIRMLIGQTVQPENLQSPALSDDDDDAILRRELGR